MREKCLTLISKKSEKIIRVYILLLAIDAIFLKLSQNRLSEQVIGTYLAIRIGLIGVSFIIILGEILKTFGDRFEDIVEYLLRRRNLSKEKKKEYRRLTFRFVKFLIEVAFANCIIGVLLVTALHQTIFSITATFLLMSICAATLIRSYFLTNYKLSY